MNAAEARKEYNKPYTLEEILAHIESRAVEAFRVYGYKRQRLTTEVELALRNLGFAINVEYGEVEISWIQPS